MNIEASSSILNSRRSKLFVFLFGVFLSNAVVAEIIGAKIFSLEATLGFQPLHLDTFLGIWDINQPAGALNWPFVFITSDLINEYFGKKGVRRVSFLTAAFIAYSFIIIYGATKLAPADFWIDVNKGDDNFNINYAFGKIFRQGLGIILGSLTAFLISQILDAYVFHYLRTKTVEQWVSTSLNSYLYKFFAAIVLTPFIYLAHNLIDKYLAGEKIKE
jgi:queuosine precursor transporter